MQHCLADRTARTEKLGEAKCEKKKHTLTGTHRRKKGCWTLIVATFGISARSVDRALAEGALHTRRHAAHAARAPNRFGCTSSLVVEQRRNVQSRRGRRSSLCDGSRLHPFEISCLCVSAACQSRASTRARVRYAGIHSPEQRERFQTDRHRACCIRTVHGHVTCPCSPAGPSYDHLCLVFANMPNDGQLERRESGSTSETMSCFVMLTRYHLRFQP